jgi:hypothetical protein
VLTLRSVSQLAPALLQHLGAYAELAGEELTRSRTQIGLAAVAVLMFTASLMFVFQMLCLAAVALAWDTPARMPVICGLLGIFTFVAVGAGVHLRRLYRTRVPLFLAVRREWELDRRALGSVLSEAAAPEMTIVNQTTADAAAP